MTGDITAATKRLDAALAVAPVAARATLKRLRELTSGAFMVPHESYLILADAIAASGIGVLEELRAFTAIQEARTGPTRMSAKEINGLHVAVDHVDDIVAGRTIRWVVPA